LKKQSLEVGEMQMEVVSIKPDKPKSLKPKIITALVLILALLIVGYFFIPKLFKSSRPIEKTIAVLPFRNLSNDTTQLYFCDGFMEEILNDLQKVNSFTIRSRTSSDQYRDSKKSIRTIGNELNVNYLVEGSVGREGDNLKIWVQLIDSKADKHIWSNDYTREMMQIFTLQSEIANEIATELKAILSPEEIEKINKKPTENIEAYSYYQQGNYYSPTSYSTNWETSIKLYEKAIELDPEFALAYTQIAYCYLNRYWNYLDHNEDNLLKCKLAIDKALEIDPDLPEAHLALGVYYYHGYLMYPQALEQFEIVLKNQPKNAEVLHWSAAVHRRAGNWEKAKLDFVKAFELNPRSSEYSLNAGETFDLLREYSKAEEYYKIAIILQPDRIDTYLRLSQMYFKSLGDTKKAREILVNAVRNNKSFVSNSSIAEENIIIDIYDGKYEEALKNLSLIKSNQFQRQRPKYLYYAFIYGFINNHESEHSYYDSARILLEKKIIEMPKEPSLYSALSIAYAGLNLDDRAIKTIKKATELMPLSKDAWDGTYFVEDLALIYVMLGKYPEALEQIQYLLSIPGNLSIKILELDPKWAPLKNQPEFKKILEKYS